MCSGCGREFSTRDLLQDHINTRPLSNNNDGKHTFKCSGKVSGARVIYPCKLCGKFFTRKDNLRNHLRTYVKIQEFDKTDSKPNKKNTYECTTCGQSFGGSSLLSLHSLTHKSPEHETNSNIHRCNECGKVFAFLSTLKQHQLNCELRTDLDKDIASSRYKCTKCSSVFTSKLQLTGHSRMHSTLEKPHKCPFCQSRFMNPAQLRLHLLTHDTTPCGKDHSYSCKKCDVNFGNSHNLDRHLWYTHGEITPKQTSGIINKNTSSHEASPSINLQDNTICKIEIKVEPSDLIDGTDTSNLNLPLDKNVKFEIKNEPIE